MFLSKVAASPFQNHLHAEMSLKSIYEMIHRLCILLQELISPKKSSPMLELPDEIMELILLNLSTGDRSRLKLVCRTWNRLLNGGYVLQHQAREAPWQILPPADKGSGIIRFRSMFEGRTYSFKCPALDGYSGAGWCIGSSGGWLLMGYDTRFMPLLWNPVTGAVRQLPRIPGSYSLTDVKKVRVFSIGTEECVVALVLKCEEIVLCTPMETEWSFFLGERVGVLEFRDIFFHAGEGTFYALAVKPVETGEERLPVTNEVHLNGCCVRFHLLFVQVPGSHPAFASGRNIAMHLVNSSITQRVLILAASFKIAVSPIDGSRYLRTSRLDAFYPSGTDGEVVEAVGGLGRDQAVFLGTSGSIAVGIVEGVKPSCIYFTRQDPLDYVDPGESDANWCRNFLILAENGVYSMEDRTMRQHTSYVSHDPKFIVGWFTPRLVTGCYPLHI